MAHSTTRTTRWILLFCAVFAVTTNNNVFHISLPYQQPQQEEQQQQQPLNSLQNYDTVEAAAIRTHKQQSRQQPEPELRRILFAIAAYDMEKYESTTLVQIRSIVKDVCKNIPSLTNVKIVLYTTVEWPSYVLNNWQHDIDLIQKQIIQRSRPSSEPPSITIEIRIKDPKWRHQLVNFHRDELFYPHLESYDLFVYTENDHLVQSEHVVGYWKETQRLKRIVGSTRFLDYSIGFLRYEINPISSKKEIFEHQWHTKTIQDFINRHIVDVKGIDGNPPLLYFNGGGSYHQGMFMATQEQLLGWNIRSGCHFNTTWNAADKSSLRERVSSTHLFSIKGCNVTQIIPFDFDSFCVHHLSNKYLVGKNGNLLNRYLSLNDKVNNLSLDKLGSILLNVLEERRGHGRRGGGGRDDTVTKREETETPTPAITSTSQTATPNVRMYNDERVYNTTHTT
jgi:hypothetical protein